MTYDEIKNRLDVKDLCVLLRETQLSAEQLSQVILPDIRKKTEDITRKLRSELYASEGAALCGGTYKNTPAALALIEEYELFLRRTSYRIRALTEQPNTFLGYMNYSEAEARLYEALDKKEEHISASFSERSMFLRLPLLNSRISEANYVRAGVSSYENYYGKAVGRAIRNAEILSLFKSYRLEKYELFYLFVYKNRVPKIDNDNYATRDVTNAIAAFLPAGDAPFSCSFRYNSAVSDDIAEGTYVTVYPQSEPVSEDSVIQFWHRFSHTEA